MGFPWTPYFLGLAYNAKRGAEILSIWDQIPSNTDIVMTHGPPVALVDESAKSGQVRCVELHSTITQRVKPKLHMCLVTYIKVMACIPMPLLHMLTLPPVTCNTNA